MDATKTTLVQVSIAERDHKILKTMAVESEKTISDFIRSAVSRIINTKHGRSIAERIDARNG